ncbi:MAG: flavin monoamine oxidase family protein [Janthinobacterium lividum]
MKHGRVVVIGAGAAGLAAAGRLRAAGCETVLIEAGARLGGRAWTASFNGAPFDHGAAWLHDAGRNPLVAMARPEDGLFDSDEVGTERVSAGGRLADAGERSAYEAAWEAVERVTAPCLAGPDITLAAALAPMRGDPWAPLVALWEGAIIAAADSGRLGLRDWRMNRLGGRNAIPPDGVGAYLVRKLATEATLDTAATAVRWGGAGVRVETARGTIAADAAVVTVSTGVLAAGTIRFDPPLPAAVQAAIAALPMGLLSKVAFAAGPAGRWGLAADTLIVDREARMTFNGWPQGRAQLIGYFGGDLAWDASRSPGVATALARAELSRALGASVLPLLPETALETTWGQDPLSLGAYAYAGPGDSGQRGVLGSAFPGERLLFAGEATRMDGLAGTVAGAYLSGIEAAERLLVSAAPAVAPAGSP